MAAARESALADARRESRNRRMMYPGEEKFYERLDHARAGSAKKKNRPTSAVSSGPGPGDSRASTPARARVSSAASPAGRTRDRDRDRDPTSAEGTPSPAPRSAGGSSRASRSLRVSFEAARATGASAARRAARGRDAENADPIGSDPRRAARRGRARAPRRRAQPPPPAVAAARAEAERRGERPCWVRSRTTPSETARSRRCDRSRRRRGRRALAVVNARWIRGDAVEPRSVGAVVPARSFMERSAGAVALVVHRGRLDGAPTAPATPGVFPDDGENRGVAKSGAAPPVAPPGAAKIPFSVFGGKKKHARYTKDTRDRQRPSAKSRARREPAEKGARRRRRPRRRRRRRRRTQARRASAARRSRAKPPRGGARARGRRSRRLTRGGRGASEARAGAESARGAQRDATLYSAMLYRRAATAAFVRYYDWRRDAGLEKRFFFERVRERRLEKELVHATRSMPAFAAYTRGSPRLFAGASLETHRARRRGARGRARRVRARARGRRVRDVQTARLIEGDGEPRPRPRPVEPGGPSSQEPVQSRARGRHRVRNPAPPPRRVPVPRARGGRRRLMCWAAAGSGPFKADPHRGPVRAGRRARRPRGRGAVRDARGALGDGGFARGQANVRRGDGRDAPRRGGEDGGVFTDIPGALPRGGGVRRRPEGARARAGARRGAAGGARGHRRGRRARGLLRQGGTRGGVRQGARAGGRGGGRGSRRPGSLAGRKRAWRARARLAGAPPRHRLGRRRGGKPPGGARARRRAGGLVAPAVFGEECLYAPRARRALAGADLPKPGRHAFTVTAARGVGVTVLRLAPGGSSGSPRPSRAGSCSSRGPPSGGVPRGARALDAPPAAPAGARATSSPRRRSTGLRPPRASAWCSARPRSRRPASSPRKRANRDSRRKPGSRKRGTRPSGWAAAAGGRARRARARRRARATLPPGGLAVLAVHALEPESVLSPNDEGRAHRARGHGGGAARGEVRRAQAPARSARAGETAARSARAGRTSEKKLRRRGRARAFPGGGGSFPDARTGAPSCA